MTTRLIINADDFGLTPGINRAIAELHDAGIVTSATLMANGPAFDDAVAIARTRPTLAIGCHIVLVDGIPVSDPATIPTLIPKPHHAIPAFHHSLSLFALEVLTGRIHATDIEREALAQIHKLQRAGLTLTHADTHKHTHLLSRVHRPIIRALEQSNISALRNPFEPLWAARLSGSLRRRAVVRSFETGRRRFEASVPIAQHRILTTSGTLGVSATGHLNDRTLAALLKSLPTGTWELVCHPGYNDRDLANITTRLRTERETEIRTLLAAFDKNSPQRKRLQLIHYGGLSPHTAQPNLISVPEPLNSDL
jgi:chitin disaccharide deacetylase